MVQCSGLWRVDVQVSQTDILIWSVLHTTWRRHIDLLTEPSGISSAAAVIQRWHLKIEDSWSQNSFTFCVLLILCSVSDLCGLLFIGFFPVSLWLLMNIFLSICYFLTVTLRRIICYLDRSGSIFGFTIYHVLVVGLWRGRSRDTCWWRLVWADLAVVAGRHQPQAFLLLVLQEEVLSDGSAHVLQVRHHLLHREHLRGMMTSRHTDHCLRFCWASTSVQSVN